MEEQHWAFYLFGGKEADERAVFDGGHDEILLQFYRYFVLSAKVSFKFYSFFTHQC